jgi:hypothetical protein
MPTDTPRDWREDRTPKEQPFLAVASEVVVIDLLGSPSGTRIFIPFFFGVDRSRPWRRVILPE